VEVAVKFEVGVLEGVKVRVGVMVGDAVRVALAVEVGVAVEAQGLSLRISMAAKSALLTEGAPVIVRAPPFTLT